MQFQNVIQMYAAETENAESDLVDFNDILYMI